MTSPYLCCYFIKNNDFIWQYTKKKQAGLLFTNSIMILHRKRFLSKYGLDDVNNMGCNPSERPFQVQAIGLLQAVHYLKIPVIMANIVAIIFELLLGGGWARVDDRRHKIMKESSCYVLVTSVVDAYISIINTWRRDGRFSFTSVTFRTM